MNEKLSNFNSLLALLFFAIVIYGFSTNFYIPKENAHQIKVLGFNVVEELPSNVTLTQKDGTLLSGMQNGIVLSGELIWNSIKNIWNDYRDFPDNFLLKIIWFFIGIPIEIIKWLLLAIPVFLVMLYQLITIDSSFSYKISLLISSLIPIAILVYFSKIEED